MGLEETLDHYGALVEERLREFLAEALSAAEAYHPFIRRVYSDMEEFVLRKGKRLASCSNLIAYKGYAGEVDDRILRACVGIELYRHCILVHDDLVDRDGLRRGRKTLHELFAQNHDRRLGEGSAVFVGDLMYALALQALLSADFPPERLGRAVQLLAEGYRRVNESQVLDLLFEYEEPGVDEWYTMASRRAASLFETTVLAGAVLGGAPEGDIPVLREAAEHMGYSFDIQDDIIDTFASREQYGRPPGGDIAQGKKPLYLIHALRMADPDRLEALRNLVGKKKIRPRELETLREVIRGSGALEAAKEGSRRHAEAARKLIDRTAMSGEAKGFFASLITYIEESLDWYR